MGLEFWDLGVLGLGPLERLGLLSGLGLGFWGFGFYKGPSLQRDAGACLV